MTADALIKIGIKPVLVVEDAEHDDYAKHNPGCQITVWPQSYMDEYEKTPEMDPHPTTGPAHNFAWDHSRAAGFTHHWIMDDNIGRFYVRINKKRHLVTTEIPFGWHETFIQKWENLAGICLGQSQNQGLGQTLILNTRLYCATLYRNDLNKDGIKWRRGLNDDTIVSLDILKTGYWCTAQSYALGIAKTGTSRKARLKGGMTDFYAEGGFIRKSAELVRCHPDVCHTIIRYDRVHHFCDYKRFTQTLIPAGVCPA